MLSRLLKQSKILPEMAVLFYDQGKDQADTFFLTSAVPKVLRIPTNKYILNYCTINKRF